MPEPCHLGQDDWNRLCETIRRGYCILVLGPEATLLGIVRTEPDCFMMGSNKGNKNELPVREVCFTGLPLKSRSFVQHAGY